MTVLENHLVVGTTPLLAFSGGRRPTEVPVIVVHMVLGTGASVLLPSGRLSGA